MPLTGILFHAQGDSARRIAANIAKLPELLQQAYRLLTTGNREFRDGYHRATHRIVKGQQSRRGLGATDGFAFVPQTVAVFLDGNCWVSELKTPAKAEIPAPTSES